MGRTTSARVETILPRLRGSVAGPCRLLPQGFLPDCGIRVTSCFKRSQKPFPKNGRMRIRGAVQRRLTSFKRKTSDEDQGFSKNGPGVIAACVGLKQFMRDRRAHDTENVVFRRRCSAQNRFARSSRSRFNRFEMLLPQGCCGIGTSWAKGEGKGEGKGRRAPGAHKKRPEAGWRTSDLEGDGNGLGPFPISVLRSVGRVLEETPDYLAMASLMASAATRPEVRAQPTLAPAGESSPITPPTSSPAA